MALLISVNEVTQQIVSEIETMNDIEQRSILAFIKARKLQLLNPKPIAKYKGKLKPVSLEEIDEIKHTVRKQYANK